MVAGPGGSAALEHLGSDVVLGRYVRHLDGGPHHVVAHRLKNRPSPHSKAQRMTTSSYLGGSTLSGGQYNRSETSRWKMGISPLSVSYGGNMASSKRWVGWRPTPHPTQR